VTEAKSSGAEPSAVLSKRPVLTLFSAHWLAMAGLGLVLTGIVLWACLLPMHLRGGAENPYIGLASTGAGGVLVLGMVLTPIGLYFGRRRVAARIAAGLHDTRTPWRRLIVFLVVVSMLNLVIASQTTQSVVHRMESRQFCGSCHVMTPEFRAFDQSPHAALLCVDCHVGDGALGFVKAKWQGARQLYMVATDTVPRPIHAGIESGKLVASAETCERCHSKQHPSNASLKLIQSYGEDEANTPETTLLTMNVGGAHLGGIHGAHNREGVEISFVAKDAARQDIPLVEYRDTKSGITRTYKKSGVDAAALANAPRIAMQCYDCHNRVGHDFQTPDKAVDQAITEGLIPANLPFVKKNALEVLKKEYPSNDAAASAIPAGFASAYAAGDAEVARSRAADIAQTGGVLAQIYARNVFPDLGVTWGMYPDNSSHQQTPGCFRCHDGDHVAAGGETITNNCFRCHHPAAVAETDPEVLQLLGVDKLLKNLQQRDPAK
jgi:nitrate/TMAO reductase-like tetraheme cytochrome c subunit